MRSRSGWLSAALAIGLVGCAPRGADRASQSDHAGAAGLPVVPVTAQDIRHLAGRGGARATLVNVWATWCAPCREEFPALLRVARARAPEGLRLVLVSADDSDQIPAVRAFLAKQGVGDTTYLKTGDDMTFIDTLNPKWSGALPATFLYDQEGRLAEFWEGMADEARFQSSVSQVLAARTTTEGAHP